MCVKVTGHEQYSEKLPCQIVMCEPLEDIKINISGFTRDSIMVDYVGASTRQC
jgi:hypothetical protein